MHTETIDRGLTPVISEAIHQAGLGVLAAAPRHWELAAPDGTVLRARVSRDGTWFVLEPLDLPIELRGRVRFDRARSLLVANGSILGGGKFSLSIAGTAAELRAEIPIDEDSLSADRIAHAAAGLIEALAACRRDGSARGDVVPPPPPVFERPAGAELRARLSETGWRWVGESSGEVILELDVPGALHYATAEETRHGEVRLVAAAADFTGWSKASRQALSLLLLTASGAVRMARAVFALDGDRQIAQWETTFSIMPSTAELIHGLAALSAAFRVSAWQAATLEDELLARRYLSMQATSLCNL